MNADLRPVLSRGCGCFSQFLQQGQPLRQMFADLFNTTLLGYALLKTVLLTGLVLLPDLVLMGRLLFQGRRKRLRHQLMALFAAMALLSLAGNSATVWAVLVFLFLLSLVWHLNFAYFGDVLRPDSILLFVKPDHFVDAVEAGFKDVRRLFPALLVVVAACTTSLWLVAALSDPPPRIPFAFAAIVLIVGFVVRAIFFVNEKRVYPTVFTPAIFGALHAAALAMKWSWLEPSVQVSQAFGSVGYAFEPPAENPLTVAVIMGESIAPTRMSLFGGEPGTTPNLERCAAGSGAFRLIARTGFSAGVASNSSVAGFLSGSPYPVRTPGSRTLFELAKAQGFTTSYLSAQRRSPLDAVGNVAAVDRVETQETHAEDYALRRDWMLVDLLAAAAPAARDFSFVYQRVNHSPYYNHQIGEKEAHFPFPQDKAEVLHNYDVGLRCYDRHVDDLLTVYAARPGAVFVFITSDHNEFLGENGLWGHNTNGSLAGARVPVMLFTNRPDHQVVQAFRAVPRLDAFTVARLAMLAMGVRAEVDGDWETTFYVNNALPFGRAGYMTVRPAIGAARYQVVQNDRLGAPVASEEVEVALPEPLPQVA